MTGDILSRLRIFSVLFFLQAGIVLSLPQGYCQELQVIDNPVLPGVADAGVLRFNGQYYIGGVFTNGSFYVSDDLVEWEGPFHAFSMNNDWTEGPSAGDKQIHASDIHYINGIFHHYWSVNYWGSDKHVVHIGHAISQQPLGPYVEPVKHTWLANRIDPHLFRDEDGKLYLYMVKFTDGNTIWVRPMKNPMTFSGEPRYLFASLPGTWETLDNRVAEGPWVIRYRDQYYMMYNCNHTSTRWGNYAIGVAQANSPLEFNHGNKYPHPVLRSNQLKMEETFPDLLRFSGKDPGTFLYTQEQPGRDWNTSGYDASSWQKGRTGFGSEIVENSTTRHVRTKWETNGIWIRKSFVLDKESTGNLALRMHHDGKTSVFLNGELIYRHPGRQYINWNLDEETAALLKEGENVLAVQSNKGARGNFLDMALFDLKDQKAGDILYSPGQPNLVRGPNGFEWWLVYMANKNAEPRGQYINRVHFFNKKLFVDGITGPSTPSYHPPPAQPTFSDLFNEADASAQWPRKWESMGGSWEIMKGKVVQAGRQEAGALIRSKPAAHYLFEAGVKMGAAAGKAGVYAYWKNENNWLKILLDRSTKKWTYVLKQEGAPEIVSFPLPEDFNYDVYHSIRVSKNSESFSVKIDDLPAPEQPHLEIPGFSGEGIPGLYAEGPGTAFDGVIYTIGWDEFDTTITGWSSSALTSRSAGSWEVTKEGLTQSGGKGESAVFKGDLLEEYEISLQISAEGDKGSAGVYPVYIDARNYLKAVFDLENRQLIVSGKRDGERMKLHKVSLERNRPFYADMKYTDFFEKHFSFDTPTWINALRFSKTPHERPDTLIEDMYKKMDIFYKQKGSWHPLKSYQETPSGHPGFDKISFEPVKAEALKLVNKQAEDHHFYTYQLQVNELFKASYHLRISKTKDVIVFLVDGKEVLRLKNNFPASRVGLVTSGAKASFNGITLFHLN